MDYKKIYDNLILSRKSLNRRKSEAYYESHHIVPICLNGCKNCKENIVLLTAREHFIAHWLLSRIYPNNNKMQYAFWCMCIACNKDQSRKIFSSIAYEESKRIYKNMMSKRMLGKQGYWKGKIRLDRSGENHPLYGKGYKQIGEKNPMYGKPAPNRRRLKLINEDHIFESVSEASQHFKVSCATICSWAKKNKILQYI
jgi:hypothetical protein